MTETLLRALCIVVHHDHDPDAMIPVRTLAWAEDIVRQVAEQPLPAIESRVQ